MRRSLSFASLLLASGPAIAGGGSPVEAQSTVAPEAAPAPSLAPSWTVERRGDELFVSLSVRNTGDSSVNLIMARGSSPGAWLEATAEADLEPILTPAQEKDMFSRMGPMPVWTSVASGDRRDVGTWRFKLPKDAATVHLRATVHTRFGSAEFTFDGAPSGRNS